MQTKEGDSHCTLEKAKLYKKVIIMSTAPAFVYCRVAILAVNLGQFFYPQNNKEKKSVTAKNYIKMVDKMSIMGEGSAKHAREQLTCTTQYSAENAELRATNRLCAPAG